MKLFSHGDYTVLDGDRDELNRLTDLAANADGDGVSAAVGRISRGLGSDSTRIAVEDGNFREMQKYLEELEPEPSGSSDTETRNLVDQVVNYEPD
ncbi:MAG: hypothetical protein ABEK59_13520 [Halobacteria archaeon]